MLSKFRLFNLAETLTILILLFFYTFILIATNLIFSIVSIKMGNTLQILLNNLRYGANWLSYFAETLDINLIKISKAKKNLNILFQL